MADITSTTNRVINPAPGGITADQASAIDIDTGKHHSEHDENVLAIEKGIEQDAGPADRFGTNTYYSPEEKKLVKKLDIYIMPIVFCMYFMNK
jgi:hypothetical protein